MEESHDTDAAECRHRGTASALHVCRTPRRQMDAPTSADTAWESGPSVPRSPRDPWEKKEPRRIRCAISAGRCWNI